MFIILTFVADFFSYSGRKTIHFYNGWEDEFQAKGEAMVCEILQLPVVDGKSGRTKEPEHTIKNVLRR
jgi:hypothetical protein